MFVEDIHDTDNDDDDNELPCIEVDEVEGPGPVVHGVAAAAAAAPDPDAHPVHSDCNKCNCAEDDIDNKVFFFLFILFLFKCQINKFK